MRVINLFAGPGSGKSTTAAFVFSYLKTRGVNAELVREYAKDVVYEKRHALLEHQLYILSKQYKRMSDLQEYGGIEVIITDSPLLLSTYYGRSKPYASPMGEIVDIFNSSFDNTNVFINRVKEFNPSGRLQTEAESDEISAWLKDNVAMDMTIEGNDSGMNVLAEYVLEMVR